MNTNVLTITEAVRHFSDYINRVAYRNEAFILCKGNKPVAELRPVPSGRRLGDLPAIFENIPHLSAEDTLEGHTVLPVRRRESVVVD